MEKRASHSEQIFPSMSSEPRHPLHDQEEAPNTSLPRQAEMPPGLTVPQRASPETAGPGLVGLRGNLW